jgi:hypothetical protein
MKPTNIFLQVAQKLLLVFLISNFPVSICSAQTKIYGKITDTSGKPVLYANVLLLNAKDSVLVKGTLTNESGRFTFENITKGKYLINTTHTGIEAIYSSVFEIPEKQESLDMGVIQLRKNVVTLTDVTVVSKKPLYEQKIDRLVINVAASVSATGITALDVLERSPGIVLNRISNSLSINGKGGVIIMINGKRNYMDIAAVIQMLSGMPSSNIERIEIITTPPAKYDADGDAGIINIILKSNNQFGTNGSYTLTAGYSKREDNSGSININHRKGKVNLFGNYSYTRNRPYQLWTNYHAVNNSGVFLEDYSESNRHPLAWQHDLQTGIDYEMNKKTIFGALFTGSYRHWSMEADNNAIVSVNHVLDSTVNTINHELHTTGSYGLNINMQHTFKPDEKIAVNFDYLDYYDKNPNDYNNAYFNAGNSFVYDEKVKSNKITPLKFWIGAVDYEKKLSKKINMEAGLKSTTSRLSNDVNVSTLVQNSWITDTSLSGYHKLKENIEAAYTSFSIAFNEKTSIKTGLRYEYAHTVLGSATATLVNRHYGNLFPTFYIQHKINDSNSVNISYSRRIWRPSFADLAPWVIFYDPKTFQTGNPYLLPSISDELNFSYTYKNKILSLAYSYTANPISNQPELDEKTNRLINTVTNSKSFQTIYINLSLPFKITKWWSMQNNLAGSWRQSNSFYKTTIKATGTAFFGNTTQTFTLPKDFSIELSGWYSSGGSWGLYNFSSLGSVDFGMQKKLEKIKSSLSFNVRNIFNSLVAHQSINLPQQNLIIKSSGIFGYRGFSITYNHRFGKDSVKGKRERSTGAEDERGRAY